VAVTVDLLTLAETVPGELANPEWQYDMEAARRVLAMAPGFDLPGGGDRGARRGPARDRSAPSRSIGYAPYIWVIARTIGGSKCILVYDARQSRSARRH
jgi:hypothetical protein